MERLTYKLKNENGEETGTIVYDSLSSDFSGPTVLPQTELEKCALKKLAAYEDTELAPDEIEDMERRFSSFLCEMTKNRLSKTNYTVEAMVSCADDCREEDCEDCWERKELLRYQELDEQGRLVILPCKVGDKVWLTSAFFQYFEKPVRATVQKVEWNGEGSLVPCQILMWADIGTGLRTYGFSAESIGHTIYFTREEAEAALKEQTINSK